MEPEEKASACKMIAESAGRKGDQLLGYVGVAEARISLEVRFKLRILCARVGFRKNDGYSKMIWILERFLNEGEFYVFLRDLIGLVEDHLRCKVASAHLLNGLGFLGMTLRMERRIGA